jgi:hypothetical protein
VVQVPKNRGGGNEPTIMTDMTHQDHLPDPDDDAARPWEQPGAVRRDAAPNRAELLAILGKASLGCGVLSVLLGAPALVGIPLGLITVILAKRDLLRMWEGTMDPRGRDQTELARRRGEYGAVMSGFGPLASVIVWWLLVAAFFTRY